MGIRDVAYWFYDRNATPDFKQLVEKSLSLFGVFTGVTLSFYIKDFLFGDNIPVGFLDFSIFDRVLISACVIGLLLRYIVGSAVHLNATYVAKVTTRIENDVLVESKEPKSRSMWWLFFDISFLVAFGLLAVVIIYSADMDKFLAHSAAFIFVGLAWSVIAWIGRPGDRPIAKRWTAIDGFQFAVTLGLWAADLTDFHKTWALTLLYGTCLFVDFWVVSRPPAAGPADPAALAARIAALDAERAALEAQLAALAPPPAVAPAPVVAVVAAVDANPVI